MTKRAAARRGAAWTEGVIVGHVNADAADPAFGAGAFGLAAGGRGLPLGGGS